MSMEFGIGLLGKYPYKTLISLAQKCEEIGFDQIWMPDERFYRECYSQLAVIAQNTTKVKLGTAVTDPYSRHPAMTAAALASVDEISEGRMTLGYGAGVSGFAEMGIKREKPARALREAVNVIRPLLQGERVTVEGDVIQVKEAKLDFTPLRPDIPILIAGAAPLVLKTAGRVADGVILGDYASTDVVEWGLQQVEKGAKDAGRSLDDLQKTLWLQTFIHPDGKVARDNARWMVAFVLWGTKGFHDKLGIELPKELEESLGNLSYHLSPEAAGEVGKLVPDELVRKFSLAGSPEEITEQIKEQHEMGIHQVAIHPWAFEEMTSEGAIELFAEKVIPNFR
ncbi:LLM class flavin-dependent oxidoreductase [Alkalihalobacterium alkalinitrilicum]|uniref:LLM class flavin-dependent oxidoreductase n=1 Tax=Alkalihalobacterium alkalinitrilicum TaxID=427920 RepID=UPI0009956663|nr:LLM class flavin-dependent oxidoreductase [Alkalihalobacterium alkalinitrilicum]